jgi:CheY-like chemotaxis protein
MDAIGKLTGGIAHDFNNLLAAVIGGLGLLERRSPLDDEQRRILGMTKRAAEQGTELVRRLLAFARRQNLEPQAIALGALREAVAGLLAHTLGGLVHIEWQVGNDVWLAFADQTQLELALVNLIINARDAMPDGGTVTISAENCHVANEEVPGVSAGDFVRLTIRDTGSGIAPEVLEKVTEPFFTTKEQGKGSGLGLSMVYGFAKQSNGAFRIESELGHGTVAELWLPRAPAKPTAEQKPPAKRKRREPIRKMKILLVDDHAEVRSTTAAVLSEQGHQVVEAVDGKEALEALRSRDCDYGLLISDYAMPHLSGADFVREARTLCPDVPALIITGYAEAQAVSGRPDGVEILLKPFTEGALEAAIARACSPAPVAG